MNGGRLSRRQHVLDAAAKLFREKGYEATSMRDIAEQAGVQAASLYYHFPSKAELLVAVYAKTAEQLIRNIFEAVNGIEDPWKRLEAASAAHMRNNLEGSDYVQLVFMDIPRNIGVALRARLTAQRDLYEDVFRQMITELPISRKVSPKYLLLTLFGAMAWARVWYRPGGDTPQRIAKKMVSIIRFGSEASPRGREYAPDSRR